MIAVRAALRDAVGRAVAPLRADLEADPYLRYLLALAVLTCGFGIWFRVPNFAVADEYSRLIQPMKVAGEFVADPSVESIRAGVLDGRALGATFYLYAVVLAPVFLMVVASGQLGEFASLGTIQSRWELWHAAPAWFWTSSLLLGRLVSVALGVGCVYLTYRLGVRLRDRFAGRLAAVLLAFSVGFLSETHLVGEDVPMLFLLLATVVLADRYVATGDAATFLVGALTGGLAIAFKLSGGVAAVVLGAALLLRAVRSDDPVDELARPTVVLGGLLVGALTVYVGIPSVLVGGLPELLDRISGSISAKTDRTGGFSAPIWYWFAYQYVGALGFPLFVAALGGAVGTVYHLAVRRDGPVDPLYYLLAVSVLVFLAVYSRWEFVRVRHLVPTVPALFVLFAAEVSRLRDHEHVRVRQGLKVGLAVLLVTTAAFAGAAEYQYVTDPRDRATEWIEANAEPGETMEVYENSIADVATPHGRETSHYAFPEEEATNTSSLVLNQTAYTEWMVSMPERSPAYVQLTDAELRYLDEESTPAQTYPERREYIQGLMNGEYDYYVAARFGSREVTGGTGLERIVRAGLSPDVEGRANAVVILAAEDRARADRQPPAAGDPKVYPDDGDR